MSLTINDGTLSGRVFDLEQVYLDRPRENCSVRFDPASERIASKQHAFIEASLRLYLTDNQSTMERSVTTTESKRSDWAMVNTIQFGRNGITARVAIDNGISASQPLGAESFRNDQMVSFQQIANSVPTGINNSFASIGLGHIETAPPEPAKPIWPIIVISLLFLALIPLSIFVMAIIGLSVGTVPALWRQSSLLLGGDLRIPVIWLDRFDPEPRG